MSVSSQGTHIHRLLSITNSASVFKCLLFLDIVHKWKSEVGGLSYLAFSHSTMFRLVHVIVLISSLFPLLNNILPHIYTFSYELVNSGAFLKLSHPSENIHVQGFIWTYAFIAFGAGHGRAVSACLPFMGNTYYIFR